MKIKKIAQSIGVLGKILNSKSTSQENTYSCNYLNDKFDGNVSMGSIVVEDVECKNKIDLSNFVSQTINGVTFTNNNNGSITINGTATSSFGLSFAKPYIKAGTYYLSDSSIVNLYLYDYDTNTNILSKNNSATFNKDYNNVGLDTYIDSGTNFNNITIFPQLEPGPVATDFVPHKEFGYNGKTVNLFGEIGDREGAEGYVGFCGHVSGTKIATNMWRFDIQANSYIDPTITETFNWGIKISKLNSLLAPYNITVGVKNNINLNGYWKTTAKKTGNTYINDMKFGTTFEHNGDFLVPARYYETNGAVGGYPPSMFPDDHLWEITIFLYEE